MTKTIIPTILLMGIFLATPSLGQMSDDGMAVSKTSGFFVNLSINGTSLTVEGFAEDREDSGGGGSLTLGYGFTPRFALFFSGASANMNSDNNDGYFLTHGDLGVRYHFANPNRKAVPFLELAATGRTATWKDFEISDGGSTSNTDVELSGAGITAGGGVMYFFSPDWSLTGRLNWTTGEFTTVKAGNVSVEGFEIDGTSVRFDIGISWFPGR